MSRIGLIFLISNSLFFFLATFGVFAEEATIVEQTANSVVIEINSATTETSSGQTEDLGETLAQSIREAALDYPDSPAKNAARNFQIINTHIPVDSSDFPHSLMNLCLYLSGIFGILSILGVIIDLLFLRRDTEKIKLYKIYMRKTSIFLSIFFSLSLMLYFLIFLFFK